MPFADLQLLYQTIKSEIDSAIAAVIGDNAFIRGAHVAPRRPCRSAMGADGVDYPTALPFPIAYAG